MSKPHSIFQLAQLRALPDARAPRPVRRKVSWPRRNSFSSTISIHRARPQIHTCQGIVHAGNDPLAAGQAHRLELQHPAAGSGLPRRPGPQRARGIPREDGLKRCNGKMMQLRVTMLVSKHIINLHGPDTGKMI